MTWITHALKQTAISAIPAINSNPSNSSSPLSPRRSDFMATAVVYNAPTYFADGIRHFVDGSSAGLIESEGSRACDSKRLIIENLEQLLSYKQAAQYLSVSVVYLRKLKAAGKVPFVPMGKRGIRFRVLSLNQWVEKREIK